MGDFAPPRARARLAVGRRFALRLASGEVSEFISEFISTEVADAAAVLGMGTLPNMGRACVIACDSRRAARRDLRAAARTGCSGFASEGGFEGGDRVWGGDRV